MRLNVIDIIFIVLSILICIFSFSRGFLKRIRSVIAGLVAGIAAYFVFQYLKQFKFTKNYYIGIILLIVFIIIFILIKWLVSTLSKDVKEMPVIGAADRMLGLLTGIVQAGVIIIISSLIINTFSKEYAASSFIVSHIVHFFNI